MVCCLVNEETLGGQPSLVSKALTLHTFEQIMNIVDM
jgi:hypothetical protein